MRLCVCLSLCRCVFVSLCLCVALSLCKSGGLVSCVSPVDWFCVRPVDWFRVSPVDWFRVSPVDWFVISRLVWPSICPREKTSSKATIRASAPSDPRPSPQPPSSLADGCSRPWKDPARELVKAAGLPLGRSPGLALEKSQKLFPKRSDLTLRKNQKCTFVAMPVSSPKTEYIKK